MSTTLTLTWRCIEPSCDASGDTDRGAENHTAKTKHGTVTTIRPAVTP